MDWSTIVLEFVKNIPWLAVLVALLVYRAHIVGMFGRLKSLSAGNIKADFREAQEIRSVLRSEGFLPSINTWTGSSAPQHLEDPSQWANLRRAVFVSPGDAVQDAWEGLATGLCSLAAKHGIQVEPSLDATVGNMTAALDGLDINGLEMRGDIGVHRDTRNRIVALCSRANKAQDRDFEREALGIAVEFVLQTERLLHVYEAGMEIVSHRDRESETSHALRH